MSEPKDAELAALRATLEELISRMRYGFATVALMVSAVQNRDLEKLESEYEDLNKLLKELGDFGERIRGEH